MIERIDKMTEPPVVGRFYLVPTVFYSWTDRKMVWPVMGPKHEDREHLKFEPQHYHVDIRFLTAMQFRHLNRFPWREPNERTAAHPISEVEEWGPLPAPVYRRRKCRAAGHDYPEELTIRAKNFCALYAAYEGKQCARGKSGWICPHKNFPLGSIKPRYGVIVCPLHGLNINAATGKVLPVAPVTP